MKIWKLSTGAVVVTENGSTKVLTPPKGVSYSEAANRWYTSIIGNKHRSMFEPVEWKSVSFGCNKHGAVSAFEQAVEAREDSLTFLLNRRMLPRILRQYHVLERNGKYVVRDPLEKIYRQFSTLQHAEAFNASITKEWIYQYTFDTSTMIETKANLMDMEFTSRMGGAPKPTYPQHRTVQ